MKDNDNFIELAIRAAHAAGQVIRDGMQRPLTVKQKTDPRDLLTDVDLAADRIIVNTIMDQYPDHDILSEERAAGRRKSRYCWVIDPLDGTGNFVRRYPHFSTSIALTLDDEPIAGAIYDPMRDHLFAASLGGGATWNGQSLHVSPTVQWVNALVGMDWIPISHIRAQTVQVIDQLIQHCHSTRTCGSAALGLCYVAAGWWDVYFHLHLNSWDVAAGALIVREAGGQVTDADGKHWQLSTGQCLASNSCLHDEFCAYVRAGINAK